MLDDCSSKTENDTDRVSVAIRAVLFYGIAIWGAAKPINSKDNSVVPIDTDVTCQNQKQIKVRRFRHNIFTKN